MDSVSDLHSVKEVLSHDGGMKWCQYEMFAMVIGVSISNAALSPLKWAFKDIL